MRWSWKLGTVSGIRVQVHWTFLILIGWVVLEHLSRGADIPEVVRGVLLVLAVFGCVVLHELGHALTARRFGIATRDITLLPIGGVARLERMPEKPTEELLVAAAGPAVNVVIAAALAAALAATGRMQSVGAAMAVDGGFVAQLLWFNVILVLFNLLPAFPMDGGRILRGLLAIRFGFARATAVAAWVGQGMSILLGLLGFVTGNPFLIFIAIFVYLGARAEERYVKARNVLAGVTVGDAMLTEFETLRPDAPLRVALGAMLPGAQRDFPVVGDRGFEGMVMRSDLVRALRTEGGDKAIALVMRTNIVVANRENDLHEVFVRMRAAGLASVPVMDNGSLVGLLSLEDVGGLLMRSRTASGRTRSGLAKMLATD